MDLADGYDMATEPTNLYTSSWLSCVLEQHALEVKRENDFILKYIKENSRKKLWSLCMAMSLNQRGLPGQACRIVEQYVCYCARKYSELDLDNAGLEKLIRGFSSKFMVVVAASINLCTKMCSLHLKKPYALFVECLSEMGLTHTSEEIYIMEFKIFKAIDFHVPLWTSNDMGHLLANEVGMPQGSSKCIDILVNAGEFYRNIIFEELNDIALTATVGRPKLATLHLAAGAVVATVKFLELGHEEFSPKLAKIVRAPESYVQCVGDILLKCTLERINIKK